MSVATLLDGRLVMVTGKGGTGKTTYAAALGLLGAARGRKTVVCEIDTQRPSLAPIFGARPPFKPLEVRPGLSICNIRWKGALAAYVAHMVPAGRLVVRILHNQVIGKFLDFTPGSREVVILSRIGQLLDEYDLVVIDMPASGHAFSLLDILRSVLTLFNSGPVRRRAVELEQIVRAPTSHMAFIALPEDMVVNETLETYHRMRDADLLGGAPALFLNRATPPTLADDERMLLGRLVGTHPDGVAAEFLRAGTWEDRLEQSTAAAQRRLHQAFPGGAVVVPPSSGSRDPHAVVGSVAVHLGRHVGVTRRTLAWT
jgi:anion-transporting  ArsA/GET3 family ATPase